MQKKAKFKFVISTYLKVSKVIFAVNKTTVITLFVCTIITGVIPGFTILAMQNFINSIQYKSYNELILNTVVYCALGLTSSLIGLLTSYLSSIFDMKLNLHIGTLILSKAKRLRLKDFETSESYNKIQRAQSENGTQFFQFFMSALTIVSSIIATVFSMGILLQWKAWIIILIIFVSLIRSIFSVKIGEKQYKISRERTSDIRRKQYCYSLLTSDTAFKEIKLYGLYSFFYKMYEKLTLQFNRQDKSILQYNSIISFTMIVLETLIDFFLLTLIAMDSFSGIIPIGNTISYIRCIASIRGNVNNTLNLIATEYRQSLFVDQFFEFLDMPEECENASKENSIIIKSIDTIETRHLSYRYTEKGKYVLNDINISLCKGTLIALVGLNGSGKSTLIKILSGMYMDFIGEVLVNGIDIRKIDLESLHLCMSVFFQDFNKYELSLRENICVGDISNTHSDQNIINVLEKSQFNESNLYRQLGFWFNNGSQLSGGEWIRVGIARSLLKQSSFIIWDEPNAALDSISESKIIEALKKEAEGKLAIIITHRLGVIGKLDAQIIVLDNGKIIDYGTHTYLIDNCALYNELYKNSLMKAQEDTMV